MMKKIISALLASMLLLSAVACTGGQGEKDTSAATNGSGTAAATAPATKPPVATTPATDAATNAATATATEKDTTAVTEKETAAATAAGTSEATEISTETAAIETEPATEAESEQETYIETEADTEPPVEDIDMGGNFITGPKSLERLLADLPLTSITVGNTPNVQKLDGLGTEWDPHFFRHFNQQHGCDEEAWEMICRRIQILGVQKVRMMVLPGWYEPTNENDDPNNTDLSAFTFDSEAFQSFLRFLDVCESNNIKVNLTVWGVNLGVQPSMDWLAYSDCGDWISAPTDKEEFAENVSALLTYLLNVKNYTCIKELTLYNEPDWAYKGAGGRVDFDDYATLCRMVNDRLIKDDLRQKIKLILGDDTDTQGTSTIGSTSWYAKCLKQLSDIADGFDTHLYAFNNANAYRSAYRWASARNKYFQKYAAGLQYTHNEFGSNLPEGAYRQQDIDTYERGLFVAKMATAALNGGSAGMLYWVLHDERYNDYPDRNAAVMQLGLFGYADENWKIRPVYHAWGLIMSHTVPDSEVYSIINEDSYNQVSSVALKSPEGKWTYIVNNSSAEARVVQITNTLSNNAVLNVYMYAEDTVTDSESLIPSAGVTYTKGNDTYLYIPANAFIVLAED